MRYRLTLILAAALIGLVVTSRSRTGPNEAPSADSQSASILAPVPSDHWAFPALQQLSDGKTNIPISQGANAGKPVTRFEMAVVLSRIMEKLDAAGKLPPEKVELLERLTKEFHSDLDGIGADVTGLKSRLDDLAKKVEEGPGNGALVKQVFDANSKIDDVSGKVKAQAEQIQSLSTKLASQSDQIAESHKKIKVYAEVLAKMLVKMARWEKNQPANGATNQALSRYSLNEIRGLIKEFAIDFERRLAQIERTGGQAQVPTASQLPAPEEDPDPDHILDSQPAQSEAPLGPNGPGATVRPVSKLDARGNNI